MSDEYAWVIEFRQSVSVTPAYWGKTIQGLGMTTENLDAVRFSRKEDAELVIADNGWTECDAREHAWCGAEALRAKPPSCRDNYVAWLSFKNGTIRVCDSDDEGAFKVYRWSEGA